MKFVKMARYWKTEFWGPDLSLGVHWCWEGRIDFHIGTKMYSFGKVPIYVDRSGLQFAASNSFHKDRTLPIRAGVPH